MGKIKLTFHGDLVDFLPKNTPSPTFEVNFTHKTAVKHNIESMGIPHPEISRIECNGRPVGLSYHIQDGDEIHVYPHSPGDNRLENSPPLFILDNHLGKLTDYLRLLGIDAIYAQDLPDDSIARIACEQNRILLTRDRGLLKRKIVSIGRCVRADNPVDQLAEVISIFGLEPWIVPFQRCARCNGKLISVNKEEIIDQLQPLTRKYYDEFTRCVSCGQIYWKGSHFEQMQKRLAPYIKNSPEGK